MNPEKTVKFRARVGGYTETENVCLNAIDESSDDYVAGSAKNRNRIVMRKILEGFKEGDIVEVIVRKVKK